MTFQEATDYLFNTAPLFQNIGAGAYKEGLENTRLLDKHFKHPHSKYKTIHVGGTNGKGSVSHTLAAILQDAGYKVGLFTSPHLLDFRERIRVNGQMISEERVVRFIEEEKAFFEPLYPSFFELTTALAFLYFKEENVDVAVIEVGLGGRLDCTNIIQPDISIITNISFDHIQYLGNTLEKIAIEKAGIIKTDVPIVIGETNGHSEVRDVFLQKAESIGTRIVFADERDEIQHFDLSHEKGILYKTRKYGELYGELGGMCQEKNTATILAAVEELKFIGYQLEESNIRKGFAYVCEMTGLMGRWQTLGENPKVICDTGHNVGGMQYIVKQIKNTSHDKLHIVMGMVSDKDIHTVLSMLPKDAFYYFTQASVKRALPVEEFAKIAREAGLEGNEYPNVQTAFQEAHKNALKDDLIFVGGSTFIVADMLKTTF